MQQQGAVHAYHILKSKRACRTVQGCYTATQHARISWSAWRWRLYLKVLCPPSRLYDKRLWQPLHAGHIISHATVLQRTIAGHYELAQLRHSPSSAGPLSCTVAWSLYMRPSIVQDAAGTMTGDASSMLMQSLAIGTLCRLRHSISTCVEKFSSEAFDGSPGAHYLPGLQALCHQH